MKTSGYSTAIRQNGSALICALGTIVVLSGVAAFVLSNSTTRYNAASKQVKGWQEALYAAEAGGDVAYDAIRRCNEDLGQNITPCSGFPSSSGWASPAPSPIASSDSWALGHGSSTFSFGAGNRLSAKVTVDKFGGSETAPLYRIRSIGTARVSGLKRVGMDDRVNAITAGDSLLRKIDFNFDHFLATYGFGDALATAAPDSGNGKTRVAVPETGVSRRIELVAIPIMPIEAAIKTKDSFTGTLVDSYDSQFGPYAGPTPPASPHKENAQDGDVAVGGSVFNLQKTVYGDVTTNGGNATQAKVTGVIDNNVAFSIPAATPGRPPIPSLDTSDSPAAQITWETGAPPATITPATSINATTGILKTVFWYRGVVPSKPTVNALRPTLNGVTTMTPVDVTVNLYYSSPSSGTAVDGLTVNKGAKVNAYFRGDIYGKARDFINNNMDGPVAPWSQFFATSAARDSATFRNPEDVNTIVFVDGNPGTYWQLSRFDTSVPAKPIWQSYSLGPNTAWPYSSTSNVVARFIPPKWVYADQNERQSALVTSFTDADIGKFAYERNTGKYWRLRRITLTNVSWDSDRLPLEASPNVSRAGHNWFYGISPADGTTRRLSIEPPGDVYAAFYAPDFISTDAGNPDIFGVMVCRSFLQVGATAFHFDKQLATSGPPLDYRIASFVEDIR